MKAVDILSRYKKLLWPRYRRAIQISLLFLILVPIFVGFARITQPDINTGVVRKNAEPYLLKDGDVLCAELGGVHNVTSDYFSNVEFWVNRSYYTPFVGVWFLYSNGDHGDHYNDSKDIEVGSFNYREWWTHYEGFSVDDLPTEYVNYLSVNIKKQPAKTNVTYQILIEHWNGSDYLYTPINRTYVVLYSDSEVQNEIDAHNTIGDYLGASFVFLSFTIMVIRPMQKIEEETLDEEESKSEDVFKPDVTYLASRCDILDKNRSNFRNGISILLTISLAILAVSVNPAEPNLISTGLILGSFGLAFFAIIAIFFSFSSLRITCNGDSLGPGLVPYFDVSNDDFNDLLRKAVKRREIVLSRMNASAGLGLINFTMIFISFSIFFVFPEPTFDMMHPLSFISVAIAWIMVFVFVTVLSFILFGERGFNMYFGEMEYVG